MASAQDLAAINELLANDPLWQKLVQATSNRGGMQGRALSGQLDKFLNQRGFNGTEIEGDYNYNPESGQLDERSWMDRNGWKIGAGIVGGAAGAAFLPALAGGGSAAAGSTIPSTTIGTGAIGPIGAAGGTGAAGAIGGASGIGGGILGTLGKYAGAASDIGEIVSGGASGMAGGRRDDALTNLAVNTANNRAMVDVGTFNRDTPSVRASQTARGDLMQNIQPYRLSGSGRDLSGSGGLTPEAFGPNTRQAGETLSRDSLAALMNKSDQIQPQIAQPSSAGVGENLAGGVGAGLSILGALGKLRRPDY